MKTITHLGGMLYGRPHFITQEALDALHEGYQSALRGGSMDVEGLGEMFGQMVGKFTGFKMESAPADGRDDSGFIRIGSVAVVGLGGVIARDLPTMKRLCFGGCDLNLVDAALLGAASDKDIKHVVLNCNSPGGSATGTPETAALFRTIGESKETYAYTNGECCSAAYYIASQAGQVFCSQSAWLGSIGVRAVFLDKTMQLAQQGVKTNAISSGKWKLAGSPFREMSDEERAMFQGIVDQLAKGFRAAVAEARPQVPASAMEGQSFIGQSAVDVGLSDGLVDSLDELVSLIISEGVDTETEEQ